MPDTGLTLQPQLKIRSVSPDSLMVLDGDSDRVDTGVWASKLFRAQQPWKPLTAVVVAHPENNPVTLAVFKDGKDAPETIVDDDPATVAITVTNDKMRRLPPGRIQKTRFVRYMVVVANDTEISSVAIGSGARTMKGGH